MGAAALTALGDFVWRIRNRACRSPARLIGYRLTRNILGFVGSSVAAYLLAQYFTSRNSQAGDNA